MKSIKRSLLVKSFAIIMSFTIWTIVATSCDSDAPDPDVIWDIAPVFVKVDILNDSGQSLLDPTVDGNIVGESMTLQRGKEKYEVNWNPEQKSTRALLVKFEGLNYREIYKWNESEGKFEPTGNYRIVIGGFYGDRNYREEMMLTYAGKTYEIIVENNFRWNKKKPCITTTLYLNGERIDDKEIVIYR